MFPKNFFSCVTFITLPDPSCLQSSYSWRVKVIWVQERTGRARKTFDHSCAQVTFKRLHAAASYVSAF